MKPECDLFQATVSQSLATMVTMESLVQSLAVTFVTQPITSVAS